jgi:hypothetical protein
MKVLQSVKFSKSGNVWKYPFWDPLMPKKVVFNPWSVRTYVCTTYMFKWEKVVLYKISQERFVIEV